MVRVVQRQHVLAEDADHPGRPPEAEARGLAGVAPVGGEAVSALQEIADGLPGRREIDSADDREGQLDHRPGRAHVRKHRPGIALEVLTEDVEAGHRRISTTAAPDRRSARNLDLPARVSH